MTSPPNIVVVVVDRLGAGWLGPYGNTWIPTPELNQLAAQSVLCEFMQSDSCELDAVYRSYFTGMPAYSTVESGPSLAHLAQEAGYTTNLLTDDETLARHPLCEHFQDVEWTDPPAATRLARDVKQTLLADLFSYAESRLRSRSNPVFFWLHAGALNSAWDAPYELRKLLTAEDDPPTPRFVRPPHFVEAGEPDLLLEVVQAYAAQVMVLDQCLGSFLAAVDEALDPANTVVVFTSPRGYSLGERPAVGHPGKLLKIGPVGDALRGELLQVPLLVRFPGARGRLARLTGLHQPADVFQLIKSQLVGEAASFASPLQKLAASATKLVVVSSAGDELAIRTPAWFFRQGGTSDERRVELYVKPDDRWEVNEVSARAGEVVAGFEQFAAWVAANRHLPTLSTLPDLPPELFEVRR